MEQEETGKRDQTGLPPERNSFSPEEPNTPAGWREYLVAGWNRQPLWAKTLIAGGGTSGAVFAAVFVVGAVHEHPQARMEMLLPSPGAISFRQTVPVRRISPAPANVEGIVSAAGPAAGSPNSTSYGTASPAPQPVPTSPVPKGGVPVSPDTLWRQVGTVAVEVAQLSEAVKRLDAEDIALLRGQEWIERKMTPTTQAPTGQDNRQNRSQSAPLADDQTPSPANPGRPKLTDWRVIGVSGNGAVLVDPSGTDHLVRKDSVLEGLTVVGINTETGHVRLSDGEILTP